MALRFNIEMAGFQLRERRRLRRWLTECAKEEGFSIGSIEIIFCSAEYLLSINRQFLSHDYYTDIITFDYSEGGVIHGELYIDVETVADNAAQFGTPPLEELHRVMAHGVLHLCGQGDKSKEEAALMRQKEARALNLLAATI